MPLKRLWVLARSNGRPTLMHRMVDGDTEMTRCGINVARWSRAFTRAPIPEVLCMRRACRVDES